MRLQSLLLIGAGIATVVTVTSATYGIWQLALSNGLQLPQLSGFRQSQQASPPIQSASCITVVTDPNPPLNVRSSPVIAPDNVVGKLPNGTRLFIEAEQEQWLQISAPLKGWVYETLTVTTCPTRDGAPIRNSATTGQSQAGQRNDSGAEILANATEQYQAGNLEAALGLATSVSSQSAAYQEAQIAIAQWQQDWKLAETQFYAAQQAFKAQQWQTVLNSVNGFPDIRFWREKLAPLVKIAIEQQAKSSGDYQTAVIQVTVNQAPISISGRFDGSGIHQYLLKGAEGQTLIVNTGGSNPLPSIIAPNGVLIGGGSSYSQKNWTGQLPLDGEYILKLDSSHQTYDYVFSVQLKP